MATLRVTPSCNKEEVLQEVRYLLLERDNKWIKVRQKMDIPAVDYSQPMTREEFRRAGELDGTQLGSITKTQEFGGFAYFLVSWSYSAEDIAADRELITEAAANCGATVEIEQIAGVR